MLLSGMSAEPFTIVVKTLVYWPRPSGAAAADLVQTASFPSGHVIRAVVTLGLLFALLAWRRPHWRLPAVLAITAYLLLLGLARVASGEHWPSDVLGGYLMGGFWLEILLLAWTWWDDNRRRP